MKSGCRLIDLPKVPDPRGNLTFVEGMVHVPFDIQRVFYLYDVPGGAERGGHCLKTCHQFVIAMSGSFDVTVDDGSGEETVRLDRSYFGLYIPPMVWRDLRNFSSGAVSMVIASSKYDEHDYYREWDDFVAAIRMEGS